MRAWIVSDIHADHYPWMPSRIPTHDVMIIAGDVGDDREDALIELINLHARTRRPIVFVPGNHDVFGSALDAFDSENRLLLAQDIHVLSSVQSVAIGGVRFVGATLWTNFALADDVYASEAWAAKHMPEYQRVRRADGSLIWPADTAAAHVRHRDAIEAVLATSHTGPTVVITHHAPSRKSIDGSVEISDAAFASDLDEMILRHRPTLWVHGHIHQHRDYLVGDTRILANPRGYEGPDWYENSGFIEDLVVEV